MRRKISVILTILSMGISANAATVSTQAGGLAEAIGSDTTATELTVTGEINAADIEFIAGKMTSLKHLDLSGVGIAAYSGDALMTGKTDFAANLLPEYSMMGTGLESLVLPSTLVEIGEAALAGNDALVSIEIPSAVTRIGSYALMDCDKLETVTVGGGVTEVSEGAFARCVSLKAVNLSSGVQTIGRGAFSGCKALASIAFPASLKKIEAEAFMQSGLESIDMAGCGSLSTIGDWAFARCESLATTALNSNTSSIGEGAFFGCPQLVDFTTPTAVTAISDYMFKGDASIASDYILHDGITAIGRYSLMDMSNVATFEIPASVETIGDNAFEGWTALAKLNVSNHNAVPELGNNVWQDVNQPEAILYVSEEMFDAFSTADQWKEFKVTISSSTGNDTELVDDSQIQAFFAGSTLHIAASSEIAAVRVYDSAGSRYANIAPHSESVTIDASNWSCRIYIINVVLSTGEQSTVKIARGN